jgi:hypothetical protein
VNANRVEKLLAEKFSQFFSPIDSVNKDNHLIEGQSVQKMGQLFKLFVLY